MDRPRPGTPDSQAYLDRASPASSSRYTPSLIKQSQIPMPRSPHSSDHGHGQGHTYHSSVSSFASKPSQRPSFETRPSFELRLMDPLRKGSEDSARRSSESSAGAGRLSIDSQTGPSRARFGSAGNAPMLNLNLNFTEDDTMFDLASLLKVGGGPSPVRSEFPKPRVGLAASAPPSTTQPPHQTPITPPPLLNHNRPRTVRRPTNEALNSYQMARPLAGSSSGSGSLPGQPIRSTDSSPVKQAHPNRSPNLSRKEVPKIDLALELALEMEAAIPSNSPLLESVHAPLALDSDDETERGRSTPAPFALEGSSNETTQAPVIFGDEPSPKRPRRRSLASLLSLKPDSDEAKLTPQKNSPARRPSQQLGVYAIDKSLPPTPPDGPLAQRLAASAKDHSTDSPTKGVASSGSAFSRGFSKLKNRNGSTSSQGTIGGTSPQQQATGSFGKKSLFRGRNGSVSSLLDGYQSTGSSIHTPAPQSATLGKRIVDRFAKQSTGAASTTSHRTIDSVSLAPTDETAYTLPPRRASLSGLLNEVTKPVLGMSLKGGRKSEDLLLSQTPVGQQAVDAPKATVQSRRSFDLLTQKQDVARRPSTDDLLQLASNRLSGLNLDRQKTNNLAPNGHPTQAQDLTPSNPTTGDRSPAPVTPHSASSNASTDVFSPEQASFPPVARLTRGNSVKRPEGIRSVELQPSSSSSSSPTQPTIPAMVAVPRLIRSDSLRTGARPTPLTASTAARIGQPEPPLSPADWRQKARLTQHSVAEETVLGPVWIELEDSQEAYAQAVDEGRPDRGLILTTNLLPFLRREEDSPGPKMASEPARQQRETLFNWLSTLTDELREKQPTHRGACLEAVAAIAESRFMSPIALQDDLLDQARYRTAVVSVLDFAVDKLNDKAVYANTLVFSGRIFALAFFRIEGVALKLLRALPSVKKKFLTRCLVEAAIEENDLPPVDLDAFPGHLHALCLKDMKTYTDLLLQSYPKPSDAGSHYLVKDGDVMVEMSGNWLIRWTASDSDLPFAFYRAYHRQLAGHLIPPEFRTEVTDDVPMSPKFIITGPGALFLAASLLEKSDALVHRNLRSVTSIGPNSSNFSGEDSANLSFGQKPKVLELANRRLVSTMLDIVGGPPQAQGEQQLELQADALTRRHAFSKMLQVWIRACVKRTSMWDTRSVFILLDLIEGLIYTLSYPAPTARGSEEEVVVPRPQLSCLEMFDIPFVFNFVKIILSQADNTVALMRTIAFIYAHFEIFTMRPADRNALCEHIILDDVLFSRLYLHWNAGVRGYFIRLLVWRLARLGIVAQEAAPHAPRDPRILQLFSLLNVRLEAIRQRHDELEPLDIREDDPFVPKRSTICSTRGVKEMPWAVDELVPPSEEDESDESEEYEPQELVRTVQPTKGAGKPTKEVATVARVVSWLKGGLGNKNKQNKQSRGIEHISPPIIIPPPEDSFKHATEEPYAGIETSSASSHESGEAQYATPAPANTQVVQLGVPPGRKPRPKSDAFFSFEFEGGLVPQEGTSTPPSTSPTSATFPSSASSASLNSALSADTTFPRSPLRRSTPGADKRVSVRFSKRISILPPAALDLLKDCGEAVPAIPAKYLAKEGYPKALHPYAVRGLRDYEDALDEWTDWCTRLREEEEEGKRHNKGFVDVVPRLSVAWPQSFEDSG